MGGGARVTTDWSIKELDMSNVLNWEQGSKLEIEVDQVDL
jgi:hypothetical protein